VTLLDPVSREALASNDLEQRAVNAVRVLALDGVERARSGHPGAPLGMADLAYVLWTRFLRFDPESPGWADRDRFVLSAGHASMLQYALLHLTGSPSPGRISRASASGRASPPGTRKGASPRGGDDDRALGPGIRHRRRHGHGRAPSGRALQYRRVHAREPLHLRPRLGRRHDGGNPVRGGLPGRPSGVGQAHRSLRRQPHHHRREHRALLRHRGRGRALRGLRVARGAYRRPQSPGHLRRVAGRAPGRSPPVPDRGPHAHRPGGAYQAGYAEAHGAPLGADEAAATRGVYGWTAPPFEVPEDIRQHFLEAGRAHRADREDWEATLAEYRRRHPERAAAWDAAHAPGPPPRTRTGRAFARERRSPRAWLRGRPWPGSCREFPPCGGEARISPLPTTRGWARGSLSPGGSRPGATSTSESASTPWPRP